MKYKYEQEHILNIQSLNKHFQFKYVSTQNAQH